LIRINLLPKTLRKRVEPGWWRLIAIAVPVAVLAVITGLQLSANAERDRLISERDLLQTQLAQLKPFVDAQARLTAQQKELEGITGIKAQLERERVSWSQAIRQFVGRIPRSTSNSSLLAASLKSMGLQRAASATADPNKYDGKVVNTEITISAEATSVNDIETFIRAFETSPNFGIQFSGYSRAQDNTNVNNTRYSFNGVVGMVDQNAVVQPPATPTPETPSSGTAPNAPASPPPGGR
jgi:type IV pilus assembly protein PilN